MQIYRNFVSQTKQHMFANCSRDVREMFANCSRDVRQVREHVRQFEECSSRVSFVNSIFANKKSVRELYEPMFVNKSRFGSHVCFKSMSQQAKSSAYHRSIHGAVSPLYQI